MTLAKTDIVTIVACLIATLVMPLRPPSLDADWASMGLTWTTTSATVDGAFFNDDAVLEAGEVVDRRDENGTPQIEFSVPRRDWGVAFERCMDTGEWTRAECEDAVDSGEF